MKTNTTLPGCSGPEAAAGGRVRILRPARGAGGCRGSVARRAESRREISPAARASRPACVVFALLLALLACLALPFAAAALDVPVTVPEGGSAMVTIQLLNRHSSTARNWTATCNNTNFSLDRYTGTVAATGPNAFWQDFTFTVSSAEDSDLDDDTGRCTFTATPGGFFASDVIVVTQTDNDKPTAVPSANDVRVREGGSATVRVRLNAQPPGPVTINITKRPGGPVSLTPTTLQFTTANWSTLQTVRLTGPSEQSGEQVWPVTHFDLRNLADGTLALLRARVDDTDAGALERARIERQTQELWNEYYGADSTNPGPPRIESVIRTSGAEHTSKSVVGFNVTFSEPVFLDPGDLDVPGLHGEWFRVERRSEHYSEQRRGIRNGDAFYKPCNSDINRIMRTLGVIPGWDLLDRLDNECDRRKDMSRHWFVLTSAWASNAVVGLFPHDNHDIEDAWGNPLAWGPTTWPTGDDYQLYLKGGATPPETGPGSPAGRDPSGRRR